MDIDTLLRQAEPGDQRLCEALMLGYYDFVCGLAGTFFYDSDDCEAAANEQM